MTPAVRIHKDGRGNWHAHDVTLQYSRPARLDDALTKVQQGRTVFVAPGDAGAVLDAVRGVVSGEAAD